MFKSIGGVTATYMNKFGNEFLNKLIRGGRFRGDTKTGKTAIAIRELNGKRVGIKNKINEVYKSGFQETKIDHASS